MIVAGTGHRPPKLGGYCNRKQVEDFAIRFFGEQKNRIDKIISGGALGWDQAIAVAARKLRIDYAMYIPFAAFDEKWPQESQDYLETLMHHAAEIKIICEPGYAPHKMHLRNEAMVTDCNVVVALYDGSAGGTRNCIHYANSMRGGFKPVVNLWPAWLQFKDGKEVTWTQLPSNI